MAERKHYLHLFETERAFESAYTGEDYYEPWVSYVKENERVDYNKVEERDYSKEYLTIEALESGNITPNIKVEYSVNDGEWIENSGAEAITLSQGDKVKFRGTEGGSNLFRNNTLMFKVYGNIESLEYEDDFVGQTSVKSGFDTCFMTCAGLTDASNLVLPATTLASSCYESMFQGCTSLTTAPALPATTLADFCYQGMFQRCTSLTTAPELPATTLASNCYSSMFTNCTGLTAAPSLPATTLTYYCYRNMFLGCTSLTAAPELPATTLADNCYGNMFDGCTSLTAAPELPATTLADGCYSGMFNGCTNLNYIKCLATDISAEQCTFEWVDQVAANGTFVKASSMSSWTRDEDGIPTNWTVQNA